MRRNRGRWEPLSVDGVADLLRGVRAPWWIAGGWALDLHLGRSTRSHGDVDVLILRRDLAEVRQALPGWDLHTADPAGVLRPWSRDETLPESVHDIWARPDPGAPWALQLMVDRTDGGDWVYRRDRRIHRPVSRLAGPSSTVARAVLAPEVQLLYKSHARRPKDVADFHQVVDALDHGARDWLRGALSLLEPGHAWLPAL